MDFLKLTENQLDALREISNIGMGHAATALSQLINRTILLTVPKVTVSDLACVPALFGGAEQLVVGIYLQILGDARGNILMIFPRESALKLLAKLLAQNGRKGPLLSELEVSTLKEVGNILASAFLNALGSLMKRTLIPSVPMLSFDMAGAVVDYVLIDLGHVGDVSLTVETDFYDKDDRVNGHFFLLPDPASLEIILQAIGAGDE